MSGKASQGDLYGFLVEFDNVDALITGAEKVRDAGFTEWDAHTPFPVHGLDDAMGIRPTKLPFFVFGAGLAGALAGLGLQWWTNAVDYPLVISGKPFFSIPANIPVMFEVTVLFSAVGAFLGMLVFNLLPEWSHTLFKNRRFRRATTDRFFISVKATDRRFQREETRLFLESLGGLAVEEIEE